METLNAFNPISSQFSSSILLFRSPPVPRENDKFNLTSRTKSLYIPNPSRFSIIRASQSCNSLNYGGWDDGNIDGELISSGESTLLRDFFVSTGIDDKRHVFVFLLGIFCALAISRVRVSTIIVFPASVLIFAVGFSFGFFRGGSFSELGLNSSKRKGNEEIFKVYIERLRDLVDFFDDFEVKINDLKNDIRRAIDTKEIELVDLEGYVSLIESIQSSAFDSRHVIEAAVNSIGNSINVVAETQRKSSRKKKDGEVGFDLLRFIGGLFGEKKIDSEPNKVADKGNVKNEHVQGNKKGFATDRTEETEKGSSHDLEDGILNFVDSDKRKRPSKFSEGLRIDSALNWDSERRIRITEEDSKMNSGKISRNGKRYDSGEYSYQSSRLEFLDNHQVSRKTSQNNETDTWKTRDNLRDSFSFKRTETETSFVREEMFDQSSEDESYRSQVQSEGTYGDSRLTDHDVVTDDLIFDRYLTESNNLLKQAKECIRGKQDEENTEIILYKSAKLLSKAIEMKPMSLLAVGLLGNTYLLHGELKLKITRELRTRLFGAENQGRRFKSIDEVLTKKDKIASALIDACEECEELLVEAGRKYRVALSIDGNDVRALYNWGLALSFRAQLIADIGPEAAFDADKVFMAAIDKFDAMMSKGNQYAPDALFRWGVVLQQRSKLRPRNSREKVKLLLQAKRLYEDALQMDSGNLQLREALLSCVGEINHRLL